LTALADATNNLSMLAMNYGLAPLHISITSCTLNPHRHTST